MSENRALALALIVMGLLLYYLFTLDMAHGRDLDRRYAQSPLKPWFDGLKNKKGEGCCSDADGTALSDVDWESKDGKYRVRVDGEWRDVPDDAVLTEPNRAGMADRCFSAGGLPLDDQGAADVDRIGKEAGSTLSFGLNGEGGHRAQAFWRILQIKAGTWLCQWCVRTRSRSRFVHGSLFRFVQVGHFAVL